MADTAGSFDRVADGLRGAGLARVVAVDAVGVWRSAGGFPAADDRGHRTPEAHGADAPQRVQVRPRRGPLSDEDVAEAALDADRRVARRRGDGDVVRTLHRCVLLDLEPRGQTAPDVLSAAQTVVRRALRHVPLRDTRRVRLRAFAV